MANPEAYGDLTISAGPITEPPRGYMPSPQMVELITTELEAAGVELGAYDTAIVKWLGGWDWPTVAIVVSWIKRAHEGGYSDRQADIEQTRPTRSEME
jgi:hypothetical protein